MPLTHVMLARDDTAPLLARTLLRVWLGSRAFALPAGLVVAAVALAAGFRRPTTALALAAMLVVVPGLLALGARSVARSQAPAGFTLGLGLGETHLAVRHAGATVVSPYATWASVCERRGVVRLVTHQGAVLAVPAELVGTDLARLKAAVDGARSPA